MILGATTAGEATTGRDFPLKNGQFLRIATASVKVGDNEPSPLAVSRRTSRLLSNREDEKAYFADPFRVPTAEIDRRVAGRRSPPPAGTNHASRASHISEADLIRGAEGKAGNGTGIHPPASKSAGPLSPGQEG